MSTKTVCVCVCVQNEAAKRVSCNGAALAAGRTVLLVSPVSCVGLFCSTGDWHLVFFLFFFSSSCEEEEEENLKNKERNKEREKNKNQTGFWLDCASSKGKPFIYFFFCSSHSPTGLVFFFWVEIIIISYCC